MGKVSGFSFDMSTAKHMNPADLINELEGELKPAGTNLLSKLSYEANKHLECLVKRAYSRRDREE